MQRLLGVFGRAWSASGNLFLAAQVCCYLTWSIQERRFLRYREFSRRLDDAVCEPLLELRERLLSKIRELLRRMLSRIRGGKGK